MKYLNTRHMHEVLKPLCAGRTLFVFDFDGTLAPIVMQRARARMPRSTHDLFTRLASHVTTAVISGRSLLDLRKRLKVHPDYLVGNHGLEGLLGNAVRLQRAQRLCAAWRQQLNKAKIDRPGTGIDIEDKQYSLAIHYRLAPEPRRARRSVAQALAQLQPAPQVIGGKKVINLLPRGAPDKGVVLLHLLRHMRAEQALFIGDDDTDEAIFAINHPHIVTVRVGHKRSSRAQYYLRGQTEIDRVLRFLITCFQ